MRNVKNEVEKLGAILADTMTFAVRCALTFLERLNKHNSKDVRSLPVWGK